MKRKRRNNLSTAESFVLDAVIQVYTSDGLAFEFAVTDGSTEGGWNANGVKENTTSITGLNILAHLFAQACERIYYEEMALPSGWFVKGSDISDDAQSDAVSDVTKGDNTPDDDIPF